MSGRPSRTVDDRADHEQQAADVAGDRYRREIDFRAGHSSTTAAARARSDDACSSAASATAMMRAAARPPPARTSRTSTRSRRRAPRAASDSSGSAPPAARSPDDACATSAAQSPARHPARSTATANQPKSGRIAAKSASARTSSRLPPCLPVDERRDRAAHRCRRNDERRGEKQPGERRVAAHVRRQPSDDAPTRFTQLLLIVGQSRNDECGARRLVEQHTCQLHEPFTWLWTIRSEGSHGCISGRSSRAIRLHARSTRSPSGVG